MDAEVRDSLQVSLSFIEMNIDLLRAALSKAPLEDNRALDNERAVLVISKTLELFESITLLLEDINQPIEGELKEPAKELFVDLRTSLDSNISASLLDKSTKEGFQGVRETLVRVEREHRERRHSGPEPINLCATILCD